MWLKARESLALVAQIDALAGTFHIVLYCNNNSNVVISVVIITEIILIIVVLVLMIINVREP